MINKAFSRKIFPQLLFFLTLFGFLFFAGITLTNAKDVAQNADNGQQIFDSKCKSCHSIGGGDLVGPDLKGVTERTDPNWLKQFIQEPNVLFANKDATALDLLNKYNQVQMPNLGLSDQDVADVIAYLSAASGGAPATGTTTGTTPTPGVKPVGNPNRGAEYFQGIIHFEKGGTSCISCHSVAQIQALGGGALGPDLTHVVARYGGETGLGNVLTTLPFPSMQPIFNTRPLTAGEQADLLAFFVAADKYAPATIQNKLPFVVGLGVVIAIILFAGMLFFWPKQKMSISQKLRKYKKL